MADETVFMCYRRDDSGETAGRIFDRLRTDLPAGTVFRDLDSIPLGVDFREHVRTKLAVARVVLVLIGPDWLTITDAQNRRRLDNAADHVRVEVELALGAKNVHVIPILCRHAEMPGAQDLPESIGRLAFQNGQNVRPDPDFHRDVDYLRDQIKRILADTPKKPDRKPKAAVQKAVSPDPGPKPAVPVPVPAPVPASPKPETHWKQPAQSLLAIAVFLAFWAAVIYGVWTGGRYVIGKVSDYFHKPTPAPNFPSARKLVTPSSTRLETLDWTILSPTTIPPNSLATPDGKPVPQLGRKNPSTDLLFPNLVKTPTPTPAPSLNERIKKILDGQPAPAPPPDNR